MCLSLSVITDTPIMKTFESNMKDRRRRSWSKETPKKQNATPIRRITNVYSGKVLRQILASSTKPEGFQRSWKGFISGKLPWFPVIVRWCNFQLEDLLDCNNTTVYTKKYEYPGACVNFWHLPNNCFSFLRLWIRVCGLCSTFECRYTFFI